MAYRDDGIDLDELRLEHPRHTEPEWRKNKLEWTDQFRDKQLQDILNYKPEVPGVYNARILLLGQVGAGKSSFFNTISSIMKGRITQRAPMGSAEHSLTIKFKAYDFRRPGGEGAGVDDYVAFQLCDTMGMEQNTNNGMHSDDVNKVLEGNIPDGYQFNPMNGMADDAQGYIKQPSLGEKIHCVAFVVDGANAKVISPPIIQKIHLLRNQAFKRGIPIVAIVTKVDMVCPTCTADLTGVFRCPEMKDLVETLADKLGLPKNNIVPVKSYESENDLERDVDILALNALQQLLNFSDDFLEEHLPRDGKYEKVNNI